MKGAQVLEPGLPSGGEVCSTGVRRAVFMEAQVTFKAMAVDVERAEGYRGLV